MNIWSNVSHKYVYLYVYKCKIRRFTRISNHLKSLGTIVIFYDMFMMLRMIEVDREKDEKDPPLDSQNFRIRNKVYDIL